jgi:exopolyphosphatase/guanosine-5'-triphosphate,3'-diphosphate pyrophosphatase
MPAQFFNRLISDVGRWVSAWQVPAVSIPRMETRSPVEDPGRLRAALDLGSNMFRLVIGRGTRPAIQVVEKAVEIVSIGREVDSRRVISTAARDRAAACIERFRQRLELRGVGEVSAVATAAFRQADNGKAIAEELSTALGCSIDVIDAERESDLAFSGATAGAERTHDAAILDIGGASTEYVVRGGDSRFSISIDVGVISLHERVAQTMSLEERAQRLERASRDALSPLRNAPRASGICHALGGAAVALAAFRAGRTYEDMLGGSADSFTRHELATIHREFMTMSLAERAARIGVSEAHAELVFAGYWILVVAMEYVGCDRIAPTGRGVAEGLLGEMFANGD